MLKSGARSPIARSAGYTVAAACVALFAYMLSFVVYAAAKLEGESIWIWALAWAGIPLVATIALTTYVWRQPHTGGYAFVAVASLVSSVLCFVALIPLVAV